MQLLTHYMGSNVNPSSAAKSLLDSLMLPIGAAVVWPTTREGILALVVQLSPSYWTKCSSIPTSYKGYSVIVEKAYPIPGSSLFDRLYTTI